MSTITREQLAEFLLTEFPQTKCTIEELGRRSAAVRHEVGFDELRPGGTVSGPVLMAVADVALYVAILGEIGLQPLAVTTSLSINFLRKPDQGSLYGACRILKLGKRLAVAEVFITCGDDDNPVAHATATYSIPPRETL